MVDSNIKELPVGEYDAVRTLRHTLQMAERGEITQCVIICTNSTEEDGMMDIWAVWSDMRREQVLWLQRWFDSWLNKRYFFDFHLDKDGDG